MSAGATDCRTQTHRLGETRPRHVTRRIGTLAMRKSKSKSKSVFTDDDKSNVKWFWKNYMKDKVWWLILVFVMLSVQGFVYQQFLSLTENGMRVIFEADAKSELIKVCVMVFGLFSVRALFSYAEPRLSAWITSDAIKNLRGDLISHLLKLDLAYFERTNSGEIILRLVRQTDDVGVFVGQATVGAVRDAITIIIVAGYLILKSPILFAVAVIVVPLIVLLMQFVALHIRLIQSQSENAMGDYMNALEEMSSGMRTVKISGQEPSEKKRLTKSILGIRALNIRLQAAQALVMPSIDLMSAFVYVLVIGAGGYMVLDGDFGLDAAGIIAFLLGLVILFDPARRLAQFLAKFQMALILLVSLRSILQEQPSITDIPGATNDFDARGDIELKDVSFGYSAEHPLFDGLDLTFKGGKSTAIVGATGSGKTTVLSLMTRLYDIPTGEISIGGSAIKSIKVKSLRNAFSVVAQDIVIFNSTIWENIRYVRPEATDDEIWAAAEAAEIADLIRQRGDTNLGPKGNQLSGGQKQRIAIARAVLQNAPILLLDEATSALDQRTEEKVQNALDALSTNRTTVIVAHRLSLVTKADWIYVLDQGHVAEQGTHSDLIAKAGLYAAMYQSQKDSYH